MPHFLLKHCHGMLTQPHITMPGLKAFHWITKIAVLSLPRVPAAWGAVGSAASACMPWMGQRQLHSHSSQGKLDCFTLQIGLEKLRDNLFLVVFLVLPFYFFPPLSPFICYWNFHCRCIGAEFLTWMVLNIRCSHMTMRSHRWLAKCICPKP